MSRIAVITARGGSKRIPRKNIKSFAGYPIIKYGIEAAIQSACFDEVMISTDDEEIASIGIKYGAKVPFYRSAETANDFATTTDVLLEVLGKYAETGSTFDTLCCIYPTAPFITAEKLYKACSLLDEKKADSLMPLVRFGFPIQRSFKIEDGKVVFCWPEHERTRSQDLPLAYHDAGQFYLIKTNALIETHSLITKNTIGLEISELECQDIDNETDWKLAELKFQLMHSMNNAPTI